MDIRQGGHPRRMGKKDIGNVLTFLGLGDQILEGERKITNMCRTQEVPLRC